MILRSITIAIIHRGEVTHHHDHVITLASFNVRNTMNTTDGMLRPAVVPAV